MPADLDPDNAANAATAPIGHGDPVIDLAGFRQIAAKWVTLPSDRPLRVIVGEILTGRAIALLHIWGQALPPAAAGAEGALVDLLLRMAATFPGDNCGRPYDESSGIEDPLPEVTAWAMATRRTLRRWLAARFRQLGHRYRPPDLLAHLTHGAGMGPRRVPDVGVKEGTRLFLPMCGVWVIDVALAAAQEDTAMPVLRALYDLVQAGGPHALREQRMREVIAALRPDSPLRAWLMDGAVAILGGAIEPLVASHLRLYPRLRAALGPEIIQSLRDQLPAAIFLARHEAPARATTDFDAFRRKGLAPLVTAVAHILEGAGPISTELARLQGVRPSDLASRVTLDPEAAALDNAAVREILATPGLTPREVQVLQLTALGLTPNDIAVRLGVAASGVRTLLTRARRRIRDELHNGPVQSGRSVASVARRPARD